MLRIKHSVPYRMPLVLVKRQRGECWQTAVLLLWGGGRKVWLLLCPRTPCTLHFRYRSRDSNQTPRGPLRTALPFNELSVSRKTPYASSWDHKENRNLYKCGPERTQGVETNGQMPPGSLCESQRSHCRFESSSLKRFGV